MSTLLRYVYDDDITGLTRALEVGSPPDERDREGGTALMQCVVHDRRDLAKMLLAAGANVDARDRNGWTALHLAAHHNRPAMAALLLDAGADIEFQDDHGNTALCHSTLSKGRGEMIQLLLARGADPKHENKYGIGPLVLAHSGENQDLLKYFT